MRRLVVLVLVLVPACADLGLGGGDDDSIRCGSGEGPLDIRSSSIDLVAEDLTCVLRESHFGCSGECCHPRLISSSMSPVACASPCLALDAASCASDSRCYVARDLTAFYSGAPDSFVGCYPRVRYSSSSGACAQRTADDCTADGMCEGLYDVSSKFVECIDAALTAGSCTEVATCTKSPPTCPADRTPGVAGGCYTGACIPTALCGP